MRKVCPGRQAHYQHPGRGGRGGEGRGGEVRGGEGEGGEVRGGGGRGREVRGGGGRGREVRGGEGGILIQCTNNRSVKKQRTEWRPYISTVLFTGSLTFTVFTKLWTFSDLSSLRVRYPRARAVRST